ncbi:MAG: hypothetical protein COT43_00530 [Candidatus Marinimicrobia bacterium CG08_land_8_20_14_0_20_45_22]|nr:MAG: hypothetical protein COT43_00530 [Candidatus Marinimicrobia bacterium CG08_land_8_20_14_0_20_45_22]
MVNPFLIGNKCYLRPATLEDAEFISVGENCPAVRETLFLALPMDIEKEREKLRQQLASKETILFTIVDKITDQPIGQTAFVRVDYISSATVFYIAILDPEFWGKGAGTEASQMMVDYAFETLNINRIQLHVFAGNTAAIKIYQKIGYIKEGVLRQAMYHHGEYCDFWVMGILKKDRLKNKRGRK